MNNSNTIKLLKHVISANYNLLKFEKGLQEIHLVSESGPFNEAQDNLSDFILEILQIDDNDLAKEKKVLDILTDMSLTKSQMLNEIVALLPNKED